MYPSSSKGLNKETKKAVYFFTPAFHPLDNFSAHTIRIWGKTFPTAEHAFQWKKFSKTNSDISKKIISASSPDIVKDISDKNKSKISNDWHNQKVSIMKLILTAKAKQHQDVRNALKRTKNRKIIENSPVDNFWGIGRNKKGKNTLGEIWMEIRDGPLFGLKNDLK